MHAVLERGEYSTMHSQHCRHYSLHIVVVMYCSSSSPISYALFCFVKSSSIASSI